MGRLRLELLDRIEALSHAVLDVVGVMDDQGVSRRIVDQLAASGTSVGANVFEADEAMSRKDFVKCLSIAAKELSETRYWLRLAIGRDWVPAKKAQPVLIEANELRKIIGTMIVRSKAPTPYKSKNPD